MPGSRPIPWTYEDISADPEMFGAQVGAVMQRLGTTAGQAENMPAQNAAVRQELANETNINCVYANQFSPAFRRLREGFLKFECGTPRSGFGIQQ
jgi:hypothetical protein